MRWLWLEGKGSRMGLWEWGGNAEEDEELLGWGDGSGIRRSEWQLMNFCKLGDNRV